MAEYTVFLVVLIISLIIGNGLLFLVGRPTKKELPITPSSMQQPGYGNETPGQDSSVQDAGGMKVFALERKLELAHRRIQDLEGRFPAPIMQNGQISDEALKRRFEKLEGFRSTAEAELIGIKEILAELQNRNITAKARIYTKKGKELKHEKLRKMIYNSSS